MSGSGWVTIVVIWIIKIFFLYSSSVYSFHLFLIFSASIGSLLFLSFNVPIFGWNDPLIFPIFLKRSLVLPLLLFASISLYLSLKKAFLSFLAILWNSAFSWVCFSLLFFPQPFVKSPQTTTLPSCISFVEGMVLFVVSCTILQTSVHSSSGTLLTRSNPLNLFVTSTVYA